MRETVELLQKRLNLLEKEVIFLKENVGSTSSTDSKVVTTKKAEKTTYNCGVCKGIMKNKHQLRCGCILKKRCLTYTNELKQKILMETCPLCGDTIEESVLESIRKNKENILKAQQKRVLKEKREPSTEQFEEPTEKFEEPTEEVEKPTEQFEEPTEQFEEPSEEVEEDISSMDSLEKEIGDMI